MSSIELVSKEEWRRKFSGMFRESQVICIRAVWYEGDPFTFGRELRKSAYMPATGGWRAGRHWVVVLNRACSGDAGVTREVYGRCRTCLAPWRMGKNTCPCWRAKGSLDSRKDGASVKVQMRISVPCNSNSQTGLWEQEEDMNNSSSWDVSRSGTVLCAEHTQFPAVIS